MPSLAEFHAIVSGQRRDLRARLWRCALRAAETPYAWAVGLRNKRYDRGRAESFAVDVPVISVGNITLGGTGKTPAVEWIARWLQDRGVRAVIVSRGYGAGKEGPNDEALELAEKLPDVPHVQNPDRVAGAREAINKFQAQCILLDDGFQHRRLRRDLDIVLLDAMAPFGYGHVFPRGLLREPLSGLARADVLILTRADTVDEARRKEIRQQAQRHAPNAVWLEATHAPTCLLAAVGEERELSLCQNVKVAAFCGIGNPDGFRHTLKSLGANVAALQEFPDHHAYPNDDVPKLERWARESNAKLVLCTHKDLVKLRLDQLGGVPLFAVTIGMRFTAGENALSSQLESVCSLGDA